MAELAVSATPCQSCSSIQPLQTRVAMLSWYEALHDLCIIDHTYCGGAYRGSARDSGHHVPGRALRR